MTFEIKSRSSNNPTTMFDTNVHLLCSVAAAPGALRYLKCPPLESATPEVY